MQIDVQRKKRRNELVSITLDNVPDLKVIVFGFVTFAETRLSRSSTPEYNRLQNDL